MHYVKNYTSLSYIKSHYYPFGLTMAGISSKAAGGLENRKKFNDGTELSYKEFSDGSGLEFYETNFRTQDPQLGRFWQIDPLAGATFNFSPYCYVQNNPLSFNDPLGLDTIRTNTPQNTPGFNNIPVELTPVVVKSTLKAATPRNGGFHFPIIHKNQGYWNDEMFARQRDLRPLIQGNEPSWVLNQLEFHKRNFKAEEEHRTMSIASLLMIASPILMVASPELIAEYEASSIEFYVESNLTANIVKRTLLNYAARLAKENRLFNILNKINKMNKYNEVLKSENTVKTIEKIFNKINDAFFKH